MSASKNALSAAGGGKTVAAPPSKTNAKGARARHAAIRGRGSLRAPHGLEGALTNREMDLSRSQTWLRRRIFSTFSHVKPNKCFLYA